MQWVEEMSNAGANMYTFHYEATTDPISCIRKIKEAGMKVGSTVYVWEWVGWGGGGGGYVVEGG